MIAVDPHGRRSLETFVPPLRLFVWPWAYDADTRTLFTTDMFTWAGRSGPEGPWVVTAADDDTTEEDVWVSLCHNRYWWLPGARTDAMRRELADVFERREVETIAPGYGCLLHGADVVARHVAMLDGVLARAARTESQGLAVANWRIKEAR